MGAASTIEALYDGVLDGDWRPGLAALQREVRASAIGITFRVPERPVTQRWLGLDPAFDDAYVGHYHRYDPWLEALEQRHKPDLEGKAYLGREVVSASVLSRNAVVQELHRSSGLGDLAGAVLVSTNGCMVTVGMMRAIDDAPFSAAERETMRLAVPHWQRALRIASVRERAQAASSTCATFWTDAAGLVIDLDPRARALLEDDDGVAIKNRRLVFAHPGDDEKVRTALGRLGKKAFLSVRRKSERRAYLVSISPTLAGMAVSIFDREEMPEPLIVALRGWFDVTRAEAALMVELAEGKTPSEIAELRGVTIATVRSQLRSIYIKTGTRRQAEVAALVARLGHG